MNHLIDLAREASWEVAKSVAAALVWAGLGFSFLSVRNWLLERKLKKNFGNHGITGGIEGVGINLYNPTSCQVVVRDVYAQLATLRIRLNYAGPKQEIDSRSGVTLPPFSDGTWVVPRQSYALANSNSNFNSPFTAISVEFLYPTLYGTLRRIIIQGDKDLIEHFNTMRKLDEKEMPRLEA